MSFASHVGSSGRDLLCSECWGGDDDDVGAGQHPGDAHLNVCGAWRHVDQQVVESAPVDVFNEMLHGPVEHEAAPHNGFVLFGTSDRTHRDDLDDPGPDASFKGCESGFPGFCGSSNDVAGNAKHPRDREPADVGVEYTNGEATLSEKGSQIHRHRRLSNASFT
jgi:hypothetical protein